MQSLKKRKYLFLIYNKSDLKFYYFIEKILYYLYSDSTMRSQQLHMLP